MKDNKSSFNNNIMEDKNYNTDYIVYLTLRKMYSKIVKSKKNALELENEIYSKNKIPLTEKEKIYFEVKRLYDKFYQNYSFDNLSKVDEKLYVTMSNFIECLVWNQKNDFALSLDLKKILIKLQIYLNMKTGFYSVVPDMLKEINNDKGAKLK